MFVSMSQSLDTAPTLGRIQQLGNDALLPAMERALELTDDYLFDHSQRSGSDQSMVALNDLRLSRRRLLEGFADALRGGFEKLRIRRGEEHQATGPLQLLAENALEEQLAIELLAGTLTRQQQRPLELLAKGLATLLSRQRLRDNENPLDPLGIGHAARDACQAVELSTPIRIVLYKFLERELTPALATLYPQCNAQLAAVGSLPASGRDGQRQPARQDSWPEAQADVSAQVAAGPIPTHSGAGAGHQDPSMAGGQAMPAGSGVDLGELLTLLQSWRDSQGKELPGRVEAGSPGIATSELLSVLSILQHEMPTGLYQAVATPGNGLAASLRESLLRGAGELGIDRERLHLNPTDQDAVDLVAMLFDVLLDGRSFNEEARREIGRLLIPYVKLALRDRRVFMSREHPARHLLNRVTEACDGNSGDTPQERQLLEVVADVAGRLAREYSEDVAIFSTLEGELRDKLEQHRRRCEVIEKRTRAKEQASERLSQARQHALDDLAGMTAGMELPVALGQFVEQYASQHLTMLELREGREAKRYGTALDAVQQLLAWDGKRTLPEGSRHALGEILASSGLAGQGAEQILDTLAQVIAKRDQGTDTQAIEERLPESPAMAACTEEPASPHLALVAGTDLDAPVDDAALQRMRALMIGDRVSLVSPSGRRDSAKVSWISPISGRLLLVNPNGVRLLVASIEELAELMRLGSLTPITSDSAHDDAMKRVVERLQQPAA